MFHKRIVAVVVLLAALAGGSLGARPTSGAAPERRYVVEPGDTLWALAVARYDGDPREAVWRMKERNGLRTSALVPGMVLSLPGP